MPKLDSGHEVSRYPREVDSAPHEAVFRTTLRSDGNVVIQQLPLTLDVLLYPREEDQVTQSKGHQRKLNPLADTLERFLERQEGVAVCSDLMILWGKMGERDVSPDVYVVKGVRDRDAIDRSYDPEDQGVLAPCLVFEVVSDSTQSMVDKDEKENPELFARMGVKDLVLVYPPRPLKTGTLRLGVRRLASTGRYRKCLPGPGGWFELPSVSLRIKVADDGQSLVIEDVKTGERLLSPVEEEAARRAAEQRAEQEAKARRVAEQRAEQEARRAEQEARRAEQEAEARRAAEERVEQNLRSTVEDLCSVLGIEWSASRKATLETMSFPELEVLRRHLVSEKSWPELPAAEP